MTKFYEENENGNCSEIVFTPLKGERFAIEGKELKGETVDKFVSPEIFMTEGEALSWCNWLAENRVLPSTLNDVLCDEFCVLSRRV